MVERKWPENYEEKPLIEGYLSDRLQSGDLPQYGYKGNHLPAATGKTREVKSIFEVAQEQATDKK